MHEMNDVHYRFLDRKVSIFNMSGFIFDLDGDKIFPDLLNNRSDDELVAITQRYFVANLLRLGKVKPLLFHHFSGSASKSNLEDSQ